MKNNKEQNINFGLHGCLIESNYIKPIIPTREKIIEQRRKNIFINYSNTKDDKFPLILG